MKKPELLSPFAFVAITLLGLAPAFAAMDSAPPTPITHTLQSGSRSAAVTVDPSKNRVTVQLKRASEVSPGAVQITFFDKNRHAQTVELKALPSADATRSDVSTYSGTAELSPSQQSFVGIELSLPLSKGGVDTLRLKNK